MKEESISYTCMYSEICLKPTSLSSALVFGNKGNNKITELRTFLQWESQNSQVYKRQPTQVWTIHLIRLVWVYKHY